MYDVYMKGGGNRPIVHHQLQDFKVKKLLPPEDQDLEAWVDRRDCGTGGELSYWEPTERPKQSLPRVPKSSQRTP